MKHEAFLRTIYIYLSQATRRLYSHPKTQYHAVMDSSATSLWGAMVDSLVGPGNGSLNQVSDNDF